MLYDDDDSEVSPLLWQYLKDASCIWYVVWLLMWSIPFAMEVYLKHFYEVTYNLRGMWSFEMTEAVLS